MAVNIDISTINTLGRAAQFHRRLAGLSRVELADIAGVGKTVIYDLEKGKETIRLDTLLKILDALNISVSLDSPIMDRLEGDEDAQS